MSWGELLALCAFIFGTCSLVVEFWPRDDPFPPPPHMDPAERRLRNVKLVRAHPYDQDTENG